ncbi:cytochrome c oxidase assembly factor 3 homolog, mitochondrial isoform X2 [Vanacampus margaritifer]
MADMADKAPMQSDAPFATRIDRTKENLSQTQLYSMRQAELKLWKKRTEKLRTRNALVGVVLGALVLGIYGYTFHSIAQEFVMDEMDEEAKRARLPKTGVN